MVTLLYRLCNHDSIFGDRQSSKSLYLIVVSFLTTPKRRHMKILEVVHNREALLNELMPTVGHPSWQYVASVIVCAPYLYHVEIDYETTRNLLLNSSLSKPTVPIGEYPTLESVVAEALDNPSLLKRTHEKDGLNGQQVSDYLSMYDIDHKVEDLVLVDKWVEMPSYGSYSLRDGMHRLVAYGIWRGGVEKLEYPLFGYYGTDREIPLADSTY